MMSERVNGSVSTETNILNAEPLWDAKEAAAFMRVSRSWVYQQAEAGTLPHLRIGNVLRFEPAILRAFIRQDRVSATEAIARLRARS